MPEITRFFEIDINEPLSKKYNCPIIRVLINYTYTNIAIDTMASENMITESFINNNRFVVPIDITEHITSNAEETKAVSTVDIILQLNNIVITKTDANVVKDKFNNSDEISGVIGFNYLVALNAVIDIKNFKLKFQKTYTSHYESISLDDYNEISDITPSVYGSKVNRSIKEEDKGIVVRFEYSSGWYEKRKVQYPDAYVKAIYKSYEESDEIDEFFRRYDAIYYNDCMMWEKEDMLFPWEQNDQEQKRRKFWEDEWDDIRDEQWENYNPNLDLDQQDESFYY